MNDGISLQIVWPSGEDAPRLYKDEKEQITKAVFDNSDAINKWLTRRKFCENCQGAGMVSVGENTSSDCPVCYGFTISEWQNICDLQKMGVPLYEILGYGSEEERIEANETMLPLIKLLVQKRISKEEVLAELRRLQEKYPETAYIKDWAPF